MNAFKLMAPYLLFGPGSIDRMAAFLKNEMRFERCALITDSFLLQSGFIDPVVAALKAQGMTVQVFGEVLPSPTKSNAMRAYEFLKDADAQVVIGLGGGSAMDVAKVAAVLMTNPPPIDRYFNKGGLINRGLPCVTVPTTAGTGSETTSGGMLADDTTKVKGFVAGINAAPLLSVVDPTLQISLPPRQTAATGMDAFTHALEAFISKKESPLGDLYAEKAIALIGQNIRTAYYNGENLDARCSMALAATLAGYAIQASSTAANHALAYGVESKTKAPHGEANALLLPYVMRFNAIGNIQKFKRVAELLGENIAGLSDRAAALLAADAVEKLIRDIGIPTLKDMGVQPDTFPEMAKIAVSMRRLIDPNPRNITEEQAVAIYQHAYDASR